VLGFIIGDQGLEFDRNPAAGCSRCRSTPTRGCTALASSLAMSEKFKQAGMTKMRTMVARDNRLHSLFFRGEGMMAGPYIQLEKDLG
jgi:hypothetical protein